MEGVPQSILQKEKQGNGNSDNPQTQNLNTHPEQFSGLDHSVIGFLKF